jgi:hypothetical protein
LWVGTQETCYLRVINTPVHVDEGKIIQVLMHSVAPAGDMAYRGGNETGPVIRITPVSPRIECLAFHNVAVFVCQTCQRAKVIGVGIVESGIVVFLYKYCCQVVTPAKVVNFTCFSIGGLFFFVVAEAVTGEGGFAIGFKNCLATLVIDAIVDFQAVVSFVNGSCFF